ncbi:Transcriptional regulatory protein, C terminal [Streptomyces sp. DI166]|uniref:winged helix-turn-helix domain-containing protein n=1 Tax=unclassified Streptomyces TaxID=2593676 RepID=UPI0007F4CE60|nr:MULTISPECIES: winged helix-turn-helix domain-containing protein [unclassified Streptomyces]SBT91099.1 Transcriptional regulatory protein, C terminal [Streptomyces sp. DI166]
MTTALPSTTLSDVRHLHLVDDLPQDLPAEPGSAPLVGYLVFVPEGTDPAELFSRAGVGSTRPVPTRHREDDAVRIDPERHVAEVDGHELDLTYLEFALLAHLVGHPHHVHSRERLMSEIWGYDHVGDGRTVDVHIARLRRKLGAAHRERIVTVRSVGYKYVPGRRVSPDAARRGRP